MDVKSDRLRIQGSRIDTETGQRLEPEEVPAERVLEIPAPMQGHMTGEYFGELRASVNVQKTTGEFAQQVRHSCATCKHFDARAWHQLQSKWEVSKEGVQMLNAVRAGIMDVNLARFQDMHLSPEGDTDLEHALSFLGVCHPHTEIRNDPFIVHPLSGCPEGPDYWQPRDTDADRAASTGFDQIMQTAAKAGD